MLLQPKLVACKNSEKWLCVYLLALFKGKLAWLLVFLVLRLRRERLCEMPGSDRSSLLAATNQVVHQALRGAATSQLHSLAH